MKSIFFFCVEKDKNSKPFPVGNGGLATAKLPIKILRK
jgi:hypothetical protein